MDEKKPAYLLVDTAIENPKNYEEYKKLARPIAEKFKGQYPVSYTHLTLPTIYSV